MLNSEKNPRINFLRKKNGYPGSQIAMITQGADSGDLTVLILLDADADVNETPGEGFDIVPAEPQNHALECLIAE